MKTNLTNVRAAAGPIVLGLLLVVLAALLMRSRDGGLDASSPHIEPLPDPGARCPEDSTHALHAGRAALQSGEARVQRYAFAPRDGRRALARFAEAIECARRAGDDALLAAASDRQAALRATLERDIRDHAQRYALLRRHGRTAEAADDIAYLTDLGWPEHGPLADQLRLDREALETAAMEKKR